MNEDKILDTIYNVKMGDYIALVFGIFLCVGMMIFLAWIATIDGWNWGLVIIEVFFVFLICLLLKVMIQNIQRTRRVVNIFFQKKEIYEIEKQKAVEEYTNYIIENPSLLEKYREKISRIKDESFISKQNLKVLFWDFLCRKVEGKAKFDVDNSILVWWNDNEILNTFEFKDTNLNELVKERMFLYPYIYSVYNSAKGFQDDINSMENKVKEFEKNEDLMTIYSELSIEYFEDFERIAGKINFIYNELYAEDDNVKFSEGDIEFIVLEEYTLDTCRRLCEELKNKKMDTIKSKKQLIEYAAKECKYMYESDIPLWIGSVLKIQRDMSIQLKTDIIQNIDDIVDEIMSIQRKVDEDEMKKRRNEEARKERGRLLNL